MTLSKTTFAVGATAVALGIPAALTGSPILGGFAAIATAAAWYLQDRDSKKSSADALACGAKAEAELFEIKTALKPRSFRRESVLAALKDKPRRDIEILYKPQDTEAYGLALGLAECLGLYPKGLGWKIASLRPLTASDILGVCPSNFRGSHFTAIQRAHPGCHRCG
jgi:hypothetical protein